MRGLGTLINLAAIVAGTGVGLVIGPRIPDRVRTTVLQAVGLVVVVIGVSQAADSRNIVFPLVALVVGGVIGELLRIEDGLERLGDRIRARVERRTPGVAVAPSTFVEGFVAATLLYGVGPLAILGSIDDGLRSDPQLLIVKAALDGFVSIVFASTLGWGVGFSAIPILVYQGTLTLLAGAADRVLTARMVTEMTAAGGVMVMGIGVRLLDLKQIRVASLLPALALAPIGVALFAR
jgi:hypothetical protein